MLKAIYQLGAAEGGSGTRRFWGYLLLATLSAILQAVAVLLLFPLLAALFTADYAAAGLWVLALVGVIALVWSADVVCARFGLRLGIAVMWAIYRKTPEAILRLESSAFTPERIAQLRSLVANHAVSATSGIILLVTPVITATVFTVSLGIGLLWVYVPEAIVTLLCGLFTALALWASARLESRAAAVYQKTTEALDNRLFEFAKNQPSLRTAKAADAGARFVTAEIQNTRGRILKLLLWQIPGELLFSVVLQLVLLGFAATAITGYLGGGLSGVAAATLVLVLLRVIEQVNAVATASTGLAMIKETLRELQRLDMPATGAPVKTALTETGHAESGSAAVPTESGSAAVPTETGLGDSLGTVELRDISYTYPSGAGVSDINLTLQPGTVTVIVGRSGSGKTTLLRAIAGLLTPAAGAVWARGSTGEAGQQTVAAETLREHSSVVFQQTQLPGGTLRDTITAINPNLTGEELDEIARNAQLDGLLAKLPQGWNTPVGEFGGMLSGGERQRVAIARALAKNSELLLIDEATSALDNSNEAAIVAMLGRIRAQHTTVIVTHRPAILGVADQIVVLERGRIAEIGRPAELERRGGRYSRMLFEWQQNSRWQL
ncbi:ABC transporter ATP-binding protein [Leucobacter sp. OH1287]|uniref:ABC transporter ATP-binding protein n=1 Tax=Leucobacter sp. OH1287 TaxID=2491049 RepID=UPI000F5EDE4E|nr:ABC transporter ATP-binding protein [Leucobacter sp. OH1287]RRD61750.1 ABC transporter ATP-binding protein [Leucobacter sp. OH1287]